VLGLLLPYVSESSPHSQAPSSWGGVSRRVRRRRLFQKRRRGWGKYLILLSALFLTACLGTTSSLVGAGASVAGAYFDYKTSEKGEAVIVTPPLIEYSGDVQDQAAKEFKTLGDPCPRDHVTATGCSAVLRMVIDYGDLRRRIRAAKAED
jgi:hypothetical protein